MSIFQALGARQQNHVEIQLELRVTVATLSKPYITHLAIPSFLIQHSTSHAKQVASNILTIPDHM